MSKLFANTKKLVNKSNRVINTAAIFGIDCMAGVAGGVTGGFVAGVTEGMINNLTPNAPAPVKTAIAVGSTAVGLCSAAATATIVQGKLMKTYHDSLEDRALLSDIIDNDVFDENGQV